MRNYIITFAEQIKKTNFAKYSVRAKKEDKKTRRQEDETIVCYDQHSNGTKARQVYFLNLTKQIIN